MDGEVLSNAQVVEASMLLLEILKLKMIKIIISVHLM
jgi:hypothetical protein